MADRPEWMAGNKYARYGWDSEFDAFEEGCIAQAKALVGWGEELCDDHFPLQAKFDCKWCMEQLKQEVERG